MLRNDTCGGLQRNSCQHVSWVTICSLCADRRWRWHRVRRCKVTVTVSSFRQLEKTAQKPATVSTERQKYIQTNLKELHPYHLVVTAELVGNNVMEISQRGFSDVSACGHVHCSLFSVNLRRHIMSSVDLQMFINPQMENDCCWA